MIKDKKEILNLIKNNQNDIVSFGVKQLGLFGSFVKGKQNPESDIDLLVEFYPDKKNFANFIHFSFLLETLLKHRIELVTSESLSPYIKPNILREVEYVISRA
ncbi:nucleotidyltransferase domain-containing protein [Candidatus Desantisbacteria bacterium]|nr:nucleotidyltransferase domain-containing protein [Candidatus Desantisbacteria bacterium]